MQLELSPDNPHLDQYLGHLNPAETSCKAASPPLNSGNGELWERRHLTTAWASPGRAHRSTSPTEWSC